MSILSNRAVILQLCWRPGRSSGSLAEGSGGEGSGGRFGGINDSDWEDDE